MRLLITAGKTREPIDSSLYVSHRGKGAWGIRAAMAAAKAGHRVTLLLGALDGEPAIDPSIRVFRFTSASELRQLLGAHQGGYDVILHACAMTALRPVGVEDQAIATTGRITIELEPTPDLIRQLVPTKRDGQRLIVVRIGKADADQRPAVGVDAEIWQGSGDEVTTPIWIDATGRMAHVSVDVNAWGEWVVERIAQTRGNGAK